MLALVWNLYLYSAGVCTFSCAAALPSWQSDIAGLAHGSRLFFTMQGVRRSAWTPSSRRSCACWRGASPALAMAARDASFPPAQRRCWRTAAMGLPHTAPTGCPPWHGRSAGCAHRSGTAALPGQHPKCSDGTRTLARDVLTASCATPHVLSKQIYTSLGCLVRCRCVSSAQRQSVSPTAKFRRVQAGVGEGPLVTMFADEAAGRLAEFSDVQLAALLWACTRLRCRRPWMSVALARLSRTEVAAFSPSAMASLVWALARFEHDPGELP